MSVFKVEQPTLLRNPITGGIGYYNPVTGADTPIGEGATAQSMASATYDPPNLTSPAQTTTTVSLANAALGDYVLVSFDQPLQGLMMTGFVSAAGTVTVLLSNNTGADVNLSSGTLRVRIIKP